MTVYVLYGFNWHMYHDFDTYEDNEINKPSVYGVFTNKAAAEDYAKRYHLAMFETETDIIINDCAEESCDECPYLDDCKFNYDPCFECNKYLTIYRNNGGYELDEY